MTNVFWHKVNDGPVEELWGRCEMCSLEAPLAFFVQWLRPNPPDLLKRLVDQATTLLVGSAEVGEIDDNYLCPDCDAEPLVREVMRDHKYERQGGDIFDFVP